MKLSSTACVIAFLGFSFVSFQTVVAQESTYTFVSKNGTSTITGFSKGCEGELTITNTLGNCTVTRIGDQAFCAYSKLTQVVIPDGIISIGGQAFQRCSSLTKVIIPNSVTSIGIAAFSECRSLVSITIPKSVTNIGSLAFHDCSKLVGFNVEEDNPKYTSVDGVLLDKDKKMVIQCPNGKTGDYIIPNSVKNISEGAFRNCSGLTSVTIPDSVTNISEAAFQNCNRLTSIIIPNSVNIIEKAVFAGCNQLNQVTIPDCVTRIRTFAFQFCSGLNDVIIPSSVTQIEPYAFSACRGLNSIYFKGDAPEISEGLETFSASAIIYYLPDKKGWGGTFNHRPTKTWKQ